MNTPHLPTRARARSLVVGALVATVLGAGCHVRETRVTAPEADYAAELVRSRAETRTGKKKPTWKPIVMGVIAGVTAGSVAMVWGGFLAPNRPLAVTGIVLAVTVPTLGSIPFLLKQDEPWTVTEWNEWQPVAGSKAELDVVGREPKPLATHPLVTDAEGNVQLPLAQLCQAPGASELYLVDVVVRMPTAEDATTSLPVARLPAPCGGGRLSLLRPGGTAPASDHATSDHATSEPPTTGTTTSETQRETPREQGEEHGQP